jgi:hypothetical protein
MLMNAIVLEGQESHSFFGGFDPALADFCWARDLAQGILKCTHSTVLYLHAD